MREHTAVGWIDWIIIRVIKSEITLCSILSRSRSFYRSLKISIFTFPWLVDDRGSLRTSEDSYPIVSHSFLPESIVRTWSRHLSCLLLFTRFKSIARSANYRTSWRFVPTWEVKSVFVLCCSICIIRAWSRVLLIWIIEHTSVVVLLSYTVRCWGFLNVV